MAGPDPIREYLDGLSPAMRPVPERLIAIVTTDWRLSAAIRWRQLTFAVDEDFDHWICAVSVTTRRTHLSFHFGSLLEDPAGAFVPTKSTFVRRMAFDSVDDIDESVVRQMLAQAIDRLEYFRRHWNQLRRTARDS
ncbi:DUF1801 domain-containing protein [Mycolicibacterium sp. S2-37]|uniref:DUF1801 domain-containing protein n=1 Tax=Mycolicibacterium sp. S2-37 TaxID=2810297 RepID=UPI001A94C8CB|nr:DUF1801 domain-containing protein [Mycolicibacterium sp. S2-37]MBO0681463.1 DUF1801 domain-containing protein [Mycolicibacterium sp. S2-37]